MAITTRQGKGAPLTHAELDTNFTELRDLPNGKVFPKTQNVGIKVDITTPTWPWHDMLGELHVEAGAPNPAELVAYRGNFYALQFDEEDSAYIVFHMPHDYVMGSNIYIHAHWSHNSTAVTGGSCTFGFEMSYAKGHNQAAFSSSATATILQNASTTQYQHMIAETNASISGGTSSAIDTDLLEPDGLILCRAFLDSNDMTTSSGIVKPFIHFVDIHYQSTNIGTKQRAPDFWT